MYIFLAQGGDLFTRFGQVFERFPGWFLLVITVLLAIILQISFTKHSYWLIVSYLFSLAFSGHSIEQLDTGFTLYRWYLIFCFSIASIHRYSYPGRISHILAAYWCFALLSTIWTPSFIFGIQKSALSILLFLPAAGFVSANISNIDMVKKTISIYALISAIFILNGISIDTEELNRGGRLSGANNSYSLFVITGGLLMPTLLWAFQSHRNTYRFFFLASFCAVSLLCLLSGQRSGFFAGVIACVPFVFQFKPSMIIRSLIAIAITITLSVVLLQSFPNQTEFLKRRYLNITKTGTSIRLDTTGRDRRWYAATKKILDRPIIGHGVAADKKAGVGGFHNSFLQEWYNGGIAGLFLFGGGCFYALFKTFRLWRNKFLILEHRQLGCVLFCWMIVLILSGFFESKLASPSNIMGYSLVLVSVMAHRLEVCAMQSKRNSHDNQSLF